MQDVLPIEEECRDFQTPPSLSNVDATGFVGSRGVGGGDEVEVAAEVVGDGVDGLGLERGAFVAGLGGAGVPEVDEGGAWELLAGAGGRLPTCHLFATNHARLLKQALARRMQCCRA